MNSTIDQLALSASTIQANLLDRRHHGLETTRQQAALDRIGYEISLDAPSRVAGLLTSLTNAARVYDHGDNPCSVCGDNAEADFHVAGLIAH